MARDLPQGFRQLREALKPLVGDLSRVVYVSYANPTLAANGGPCPGGRAGFDIHPSFNAEPQRLAKVSGYVQNEFLPQLKALALCQSGILCRDPAADRMTFVDAHQAGLRRSRVLCARADRSGIRPGLLLGHRRQLRSRYRHGVEPADAVRPQRRRVSRLSAARALDPRRQ